MYRQIALNRALLAELAKLDQRIDLVQRQAFTREHEALAGIRDELIALGEQVHSALHGREQSESRIRQAQVDLLIAELRRSLPAPPDPQLLAQLPSPVDNLYAALEAAFRGSRELIRERAREYLDDVLVLPRHRRVLDVGCGRGEWLEVLKEAGVDAYGIDLNPSFVEDDVARGLDVRLTDAFQHLAELPEQSLSAVTAFQLVEHVSVDALIELIDLSARALAPGGLLLLETPNPDNLVVGASTFYIDPGHTRPLNPFFLEFLVGARGFTDIELRYKHPADAMLARPHGQAPWAADLLPVIEALNDRIFGPRDYAVLGRRA
jgi:O-antigen chain-terminating methyltransferase